MADDLGIEPRMNGPTPMVTGPDDDPIDLKLCGGKLSFAEFRFNIQCGECFAEIDDAEIGEAVAESIKNTWQDHIPPWAMWPWLSWTDAASPLTIKIGLPLGDDELFFQVSLREIVRSELASNLDGDLRYGAQTITAIKDVAAALRGLADELDREAMRGAPSETDAGAA